MQSALQEGVAQQKLSNSSCYSSCPSFLFTQHLLILLLGNSLYFFFFNVYLFLREREQSVVGEGQKERETENPEQTPGSEQIGRAHV